MKRLLLLVFVVLFFSQKICWGYTDYPNHKPHSPASQDTLKDFRKFLDVEGLKEKDEKGWSIYYGIPPKDFLGAMIDYKLFPFLERGYTLSLNKTAFLQELSKAFESCSQWSFSSFKNVCNHYLYDFIGPKVQISSLSFLDLQKAFTTSTDLKQRTHELDFDEHYLPLSHKDTTIIEEYALGDYLFGIGIASDPVYSQSLKQNFIYILKAGDTHWQAFVSIMEDISLPDLIKKRLNLINQKLYLFIPIAQRDDNNMAYLGDLTPQYELQQDGSRELKDCFDEKEVCLGNVDCKIQQNRLPLKQCENLGITLTTILGK